jgi:hypothetical protein
MQRPPAHRARSSAQAACLRLASAPPPLSPRLPLPSWTSFASLSSAPALTASHRASSPSLRQLDPPATPLNPLAAAHPDHTAQLCPDRLRSRLALRRALTLLAHQPRPSKQPPVPASPSASLVLAAHACNSSAGPRPASAPPATASAIASQHRPPAKLTPTRPQCSLHRPTQVLGSHTQQIPWLAADNGNSRP